MISTFRSYLLRLIYLLNFAGLGFMVWPAIFTHHGPWDPLRAVAFCFWGALSALMGLGLIYPLRMLPLLFLQLLYKSVWLIIVAFPLWTSGQTTEMTGTFIAGAIGDVVAIPWGYVFANYLKKPSSTFALD